MTTLAVITPSYAPDLELCRDLNRSVIECTPADVRHHIVLPRRDLEAFASLRGPRTELWTVDALLPPRMLALPVANTWLNLRRPYPPIRGWVIQQLVKLHAAAELDADVWLLADSDVVFVRPVTAQTFQQDGRFCYYRGDNAVDKSMPRHILWHDVARRLLGLPPAGPPPLPDYISPVNVWDRQTVLALRDRIEQVTGRNWLDAIGSQLHISEFMLYGLFVEAVLQSSAHVVAAESMLLHTYWPSTPLSRAAAQDFVHALPPDNVALMISAKSCTPLDVRREALSCIPAIVGAGM
jgi:Family of unknown function (DUF6492)